MSLSILLAILLGIVQGIAEFLPISSSGHLSILQNLLRVGYDEGGHLFFDVLLHIGTLISIFIAYRKELRGIVRETADFMLKRGDEGRESDGRMKPGLRMLILVIVGTLPLLIILPFYDLIGQLYYKTLFIAFALIITGALLFVSDKLAQGKKNEKNCRLLDVIFIGLGQMVATIPGLSRSGTTITVALARGTSRDFAVRYSFLLSIPAVVGSFLLSLVKALKAGINWSAVPAYLIGMVIAAVVGYFAIFLVKKLVNSKNFGKFAYYCWGAALVTIILTIVL